MTHCLYKSNKKSLKEKVKQIPFNTTINGDYFESFSLVPLWYLDGYMIKRVRRLYPSFYFRGGSGGSNILFHTENIDLWC